MHKDLDCNVAYFSMDENNPKIKAAAKESNIKPEILLIIDIFFSLSLLRILPANSTFNTSTLVLMIRQVEKIIMRSFKL